MFFKKIILFIKKIFIPKLRKKRELKLSVGNFSVLNFDNDIYIKKIPWDMMVQPGNFILANIIAILSSCYHYTSGIPRNFNSEEEFKDFIFIIINKLKIGIEDNNILDDKFCKASAKKVFSTEMLEKGAQFDINEMLKKASEDKIYNLYDYSENGIRRYWSDAVSKSIKEAFEMLSKIIETLWI